MRATSKLTFLGLCATLDTSQRSCVATTFDIFGRALSSSAHACRPLPSFRTGAVDAEPAEQILLTDGARNPLLRTLVNRSADAPLGYPLGGTPLVGGVLAAPLPGALPLDLERFDRVLRAAADDRTSPTLNVLVLGGSMTSGRMMTKVISRNTSNCLVGLPSNGEDRWGYPWRCYNGAAKTTGEGDDCKPCAFPARFETWLRAAYPHKNVSVVNVARGGVGSSACVGMLGGILKANDLGSSIDVVIMNFVHNDNGVVANARKRARMSVEAAHPNEKDKALLERLKANLVKMEELAVLRDHEALLREVLALPRQPAVLELELIGEGGMDGAGVYPFHGPVMAHYQVPSLSWKQASISLKATAQGHPPWPWHQLVADWLAYTWTRLAEHACEGAAAAAEVAEALSPELHDHDLSGHNLPPPRWATGDSTGYCGSPLTFIDARATHAISSGGSVGGVPVAEVVRGNWTFGEDAPNNGKKGWWIDDPLGGAIAFRVNISVGTPHTGGLGYLSSWHPSSGVARVSIATDPVGWFTLVNASSDQHTSTTKFHRLCVSSGEHELANGAQAAAQTVLPSCSPSARAAATAAAAAAEAALLNSTGAAPAASSAPGNGPGASFLPAWLASALQEKEAAAAAAVITTTALLQIEVLPRPQRNKFVIRYISTC